MDIKIKSRNGTILKTKDKVLYEDINISIDQDLFEHSTEAEDGLITRTIKKYYNDRISSIGDRAFKE